MSDESDGLKLWDFVRWMFTGSVMGTVAVLMPVGAFALIGHVRSEMRAVDWEELDAETVARQTSEDPRCPVEYTAPNNEAWYVVLGTDTLSSHPRVIEAIERANVVEDSVPADSVWLRGQFRVECPEDWTPPVAGVDTVLVETPGTIDDLETHQPTETGFLLRWTEVGDGLGNPAWYEVRVRPEGDTTSWIYPDQVVTEGTCAIGTVQGDGIGTPIECTVEGLDPGVIYESKVRAYRLSGTTGG